MAQITVRNLNPTVKDRLEHLAHLHGHSLEEEVRQILICAAKELETAPIGLGSRIVAGFANIGLTEDLPKLRGQRPRPAKF